MNEKIQLYLEAGAIEVWLVSTEGTITFYNVQGELETSGFGVNITPIYL